jgi:hypothetical protein
MIARVLRITPTPNSDRAFADAGNVSDWARGYTNALINAGIVNGMTPTQIMPLIDINRGSVAQILHGAISTYAHQPGTFQGGGTGITLVVSNGVTITGAVDSLIIGDGVAGGNVTVNANSVQRLTVAANSTVTINNSNVGNLIIDGNNARVVLNGTTVNSLVVNGNNVNIELNSGSTVNSLTVAGGVTGTVVTVDESSTLNNVVDNSGVATIIDADGPAVTPTPDLGPSPTPAPQDPGPQDPAPTPSPDRAPSPTPGPTPIPTPTLAPGAIFAADITMRETTAGATGSLSHRFNNVAPSEAVAIIYGQFSLVQRDAIQQAFEGDITARDRMYDGMAATDT